MRNSVLQHLIALMATLLAAPLAAQPAQPLTLKEVLQSSRRHAPAILEAVARVRVAEGKQLSTQGAFDTVVTAEASTRLSGFYDGKLLGGTITRPIENWGGSLYGGYRVSDGRFPIYEDRSFTNVLGELKVGAVFSLLRDRAIDERRLNRANASIDVDLAEANQLFTALGVQRRAVAAYNAWVGAGLRLVIYRDLLMLAEARRGGLDRLVRAGARPRILLTENEQNILRRQTLVARAEQDLAAAANLLSLFLRDDAGAPMQPDPARLPAALPPLTPRSADPVSLASRRPDVAAFALQLRQASNRFALAQNALRPRLDFKAEVSQDVGPIGAGGRSRVGTETIVGLNFSVPLQRRAAKGQVDQARSEMESIERRRQQLTEQIAVELQGLAIDVRATETLRTLAEGEQARASELAQAERRRFELGSSDFFLVNAREETAADAAVRKLDAQYRQLIAFAELAAAAGDLKALGLD
ncbi:MAG: TolC family protein [Sphingomonas sp.]